MDTLQTLCLKQLPKPIQNVYASSSDFSSFLMRLEMVTLDVTIDGRFPLFPTVCNGHPFLCGTKYLHMWNVPRISTMSNDEYLYGCVEWLDAPTLDEDSNAIRLRWNSLKQPDFWIEFWYYKQTRKSQLAGRGLPVDCKLCSIVENETTLTFRYGSLIQLEFWCTISFNKSGICIK